MRGGGWLPISKAFIRELPRDRSYTRLEAMFSLAVDYDLGSTVTVRGYSDLWKWSRGKVERFLDEIGVEIEYPKSTGVLKNQRGHIVIPNASQKRANNGQIMFINSKGLRASADIKQANGEPKTGQSQGTTKEPDPKPKKTSTPEALRLSGMLADMILQNNPVNRDLNNGKRESTVERWGVDIDKLIRLDCQSPDTVERVIRWSQKDTFWRQNILSGAKLREKWDQLIPKIDNGHTPPAKGDNRYGMFEGA